MAGALDEGRKKTHENRILNEGKVTGKLARKIMKTGMQGKRGDELCGKAGERDEGNGKLTKREQERKLTKQEPERKKME